MKYLKLFNEKVDKDFYTTWFSDELIEFCEMYLAYLLDHKLKLEIVPPNPNVGIYSYKLLIKSKDEVNGFYWSEIRDHFSSFLFILDKNYNIKIYNKITELDGNGKRVVLHNRHINISTISTPEMNVNKYTDSAKFGVKEWIDKDDIINNKFDYSHKISCIRILLEI